MATNEPPPATRRPPRKTRPLFQKTVRDSVIRELERAKKTDESPTTKKGKVLPARSRGNKKPSSFQSHEAEPTWKTLNAKDNAVAQENRRQGSPLVHFRPRKNNHPFPKESGVTARENNRALLGNSHNTLDTSASSFAADNIFLS
mmetsp:Transcript_1212/g.2640  ORF Transcript_1212/g.2640 Transcript_1212/m.2640 type:complete len:145 (-) Transcript_1212:159-593(-)